jgi:hypothetical protein
MSTEKLKTLIERSIERSNMLTLEEKILAREKLKTAIEISNTLTLEEKILASTSCLVGLLSIFGIQDPEFITKLLEEDMVNSFIGLEQVKNQSNSSTFQQEKIIVGCNLLRNIANKMETQLTDLKPEDIELLN